MPASAWAMLPITSAHGLHGDPVRERARWRAGHPRVGHRHGGDRSAEPGARHRRASTRWCSPAAAPSAWKRLPASADTWNRKASASNGRGQGSACAPCAILFDLGIGKPSVRPTREMGEAAAAAATDGAVEEGAVGAGTGATVGKLFGMRRAMKSRPGLGDCARSKAAGRRAGFGAGGGQRLGRRARSRDAARSSPARAASPDSREFADSAAEIKRGAKRASAARTQRWRWSPPTPGSTRSAPRNWRRWPARYGAHDRPGQHHGRWRPGDRALAGRSRRPLSTHSASPPPKPWRKRCCAPSAARLPWAGFPAWPANPPPPAPSAGTPRKTPALSRCATSPCLPPPAPCCASCRGAS